MSTAMSIDELLTFIFNDQPHLLATPMATWLAASCRFTAFVADFRTKIHKKLWATPEIESLLDLRRELETAYLLLRERSFSLVYEPQRSGQTRGPDFTVTFTTSLLFIVEVTRLRLIQYSLRSLDRIEGSAPFLPTAPTRSLTEERLAEIVCSKLGQLPPQRSNVLLVQVEDARLTSDVLRAAMIHLQRRAERNEDAYVQRHQFRDRADFFNHYQRLSELLVRVPELQADEPVIGWINPQARYPLPGKVRTALHRSHIG